MNNCDNCIHASIHWKKNGNIKEKSDFVIALAGNPNTGKSTVFNALTGLKQHTGNWPGKTVSIGEGGYTFRKKKYKIIDLPGTYSLLSTSEDEQIARNFILFEKPSATVIVADATRLQRNLNLILQILEITPKAILCVNLIDEAERHHIKINLKLLSKILGIPVVGTCATSAKGFETLLDTIEKMSENQLPTHPKKIQNLPEKTEHYVNLIEKNLKKNIPNISSSRWIALRLLEGDESIIKNIENQASETVKLSQKLKPLIDESLHEQISKTIYQHSQKIVKQVVSHTQKNTEKTLDEKIDEILTSRTWGFPIMFLLLGIILWITIEGANYPSKFLSWILVENLHPILKNAFASLLPWWINGFVFDGVYLATAWVISVMLPPMAIFFPLFTILEDFGYLPRVAFNLDYWFKKSGAHGKQALTMTMGFGCNAAGVVSTRIIDSPRERLIAIITNNFSLCNGRWPTQILIASIFLGALAPSYLLGVVSIISVISICILGVFFMFLSSWLLSKTILRGESSTFHLELPPYRMPQFWKTIYSSFIDRTLIVLWRAIVFSAPAGALIWLISNIQIADQTLASILIDKLDTFGIFIGLNGVILLAYIVAIPANEIVIPTILMLTIISVTGASQGVIPDIENPTEIAQILTQGGWSTLTAINLMLFSLLHNPCSTTIYTIYKETQSVKWTIVSVILPLTLGFVIVFAFSVIFRYFQNISLF